MGKRKYSFIHVSGTQCVHSIQYETDLVLGGRTQIKYTIPALVDLSLLRMTSKIYMDKNQFILSGYGPNKWSFKRHESKADRANLKEK